MVVVVVVSFGGWWWCGGLDFCYSPNAKWGDKHVPEGREEKGKYLLVMQVRGQSSPLPTPMINVMVSLVNDGVFLS